MEKNIVEEIRKFVEEECKKPGANYGPAYEGHFVPTHKYAVQLAKRLNADLEVVEIAAWLHDIGSIIDGRKNHHITGGEIAEEKLTELSYPRERIEQVKYCILHHRGSVGSDGKSIESKIIIEADAISNIENVVGMFEAAFRYENLNQFEAKDSIKTKLNNKWNQLSFQESRELIKPKYEAAMLLLN